MFFICLLGTYFESGHSQKDQTETRVVIVSSAYICTCLRHSCASVFLWKMKLQQLLHKKSASLRL